MNKDSESRKTLTVKDSEKQVSREKLTVENDKNTESEVINKSAVESNKEAEISDTEVELMLAKEMIENILNKENVENIEEQAEENDTEVKEIEDNIDIATKAIERFVPIVLGLIIAIVFSTIYNNHLVVKEIQNRADLCNYLNEMRDMDEIDSKTEHKVYKLVKAGYWDEIRFYSEFYGYDETIYHYLAYLKDTDLLEKFLKDKNWAENIDADCAGTPLQYATIYENVDAVELFLEHGANALGATNAKSEAYAIALMSKNNELVSTFEKYVSSKSYAQELKRKFEKNGYLIITNTNESLDVPLNEYQYK